jgi:RNA polymerase sigma-70 factor (ECF subfamily)
MTCAAVLLEELPDALRAKLPPESEVDAWISNVLSDARAACPGVEVPEADFVRYLATKIPSLPDVSLRQLRTSDLYLAYACSTRDPSALVLFEQRYSSLLDRTLDRMRVSASQAEEYRASLRETLFFARAEAASLITTYSGRGDLGGWLRSIASRAAMKIRAKERRDVEVGRTLDILPTEGNPELQYLRARYVHEFKGALVAAIDSLAPRERNLLRQSYLDGLSVDALGRLYQVHRATAARWLADVRETVLARVKETLRAQNGLTDSDLESILRMARSGIDLSMSTLLKR